MIDGITVTVPGTELADLCRQRAAHHAKRSSEYRQQADSFPDDGNDAQRGGNSSSPRRTLTASADEHADKAKHMEFVAAHLVADEQYQLGKSDLATLGIVKSGY